MDFLYYGTLTEADEYFSNQLHGDEWTGLNTTLKEQALHAATMDVESLVYAGYKTTVFDLLEADENATEEEIAAAEAAQALEFPRDGDDTVPDNVVRAVYEIAYDRVVRGKNPAQELENLWLSSDGIGSSRASYDRSGSPPQHLAHGIVSWTAWRLLQPYLASGASFGIRRV